MRKRTITKQTIQWAMIGLLLFVGTSGGQTVSLAGEPTNGIAEAGPNGGPSASSIQETIRLSVTTAFPGVEIDWIKEAPIAGLYAVKMGRSLAYIDPGGRYLFSGGLFDLKKQVNLTARALGKDIADRLWAQDLTALAIPIGEASEPTQELIVFDDLDCQFCQKEHAELRKLTDAGWRIWVLLYPVQRLHPHAYSKSVAVWCAEDRAGALLAMWNGTRPDERVCTHPLDTIQGIAKDTGVSGTPTMVLKRGLVLAGYQTAEQIVSQHDRAAIAAGD
jgi:thiol:disulfide interchange protein DsbC